MTSFWNVQSPGDEYAPLRLLIRNNTSKPFYYDLNGLMQANGNDLKPYGTQVSALSISQKVKSGATASSSEANATMAMITDNPWIGLLKLAYYVGSIVVKDLKEEAIAEAFTVEANFTNYRAGLVKPNTNLYVELAAVQVDGSFSDGWAVNRDSTNLTASFLGPIDAADPDSLSADELTTLARANGLGIKVAGAKRSFWDCFWNKKMWDSHLNLVSLPGGPGVSVTEDTSEANVAQAGNFTYRIDGGGIEQRSDFINIYING